MNKNIYDRLGSISYVLMNAGLISGVWGLRFGYKIALTGFILFVMFTVFYLSKDAAEKRQKAERGRKGLM